MAMFGSSWGEEDRYDDAPIGRPIHDDDDMPSHLDRYREDYKLVDDVHIDLEEEEEND